MNSYFRCLLGAKVVCVSGGGGWGWVGAVSLPFRTIGATSYHFYSNRLNPVKLPWYPPGTRLSSAVNVTLF